MGATVAQPNRQQAGLRFNEQVPWDDQDFTDNNLLEPSITLGVSISTCSEEGRHMNLSLPCGQNTQD